ncbi:MAG: hypothetical protein ACI959_000131 [Limisphaerales bacterium]|jgi:hypothetical protein
MLKKYSAFLLLLTFSFTAFAQVNSQVESVEYDPIGNRFIMGDDGVGMIQSDTSGILSYFGSGLKSSFGIEIMGNYAFCIVAASSTGPVQIVRAYDLTTETEVSSVTIPGTLFLNGMASDGVSTIWVTDFQGRTIHELDFTDVLAPTYTEVVSSTDISNMPNGITHDASQNRLVFVSWDDNKIRQVSLTDYSVSVVLDGTTFNTMDGIDMDIENNFYISSWSPTNRITKFSNDFSVSEIIPVPGMLNPADICIAKEINILAVPSFSHDVIYWALEAPITSAIENIQTEKPISNAFPNPSSNKFHFNITQENWNAANCKINSLEGKTLEQFDINNNGGTISLDLASYSSGIYIIEFLIDGKYTFSEKIQLAK